MTIKEAVAQRHTVREFLEKPLSADAADSIEKQIDEANLKYDLKIKFIQNSESPIPGLSRLTMAKNVNNYIILAADEDKKNADEILGYVSAHLLLFAQTLGLNTWWIGLTYNHKIQKKYYTKSTKIAGIIALGYGKTDGKQHKMKTYDDIAHYRGTAPEWFVKGVEGVLLCPTAMNKMAFTILGYQNKVTMISNNGIYANIDLGIGKYFFEISAGKENFEWTE